MRARGGLINPFQGQTVRHLPHRSPLDSCIEPRPFLPAVVVAIRQQTCFSPALCSPPRRLSSQAHTPNAVSHPAPRYDEYSQRHSCGSVWQPSFTLTIPSLRQFRRSPEAGCVPWADAAAVRHGPSNWAAMGVSGGTERPVSLGELDGFFGPPPPSDRAT